MDHNCNEVENVKIQLKIPVIAKSAKMGGWKSNQLISLKDWNIRTN